MNILLDTQIVLWLSEGKQLSKEVTKLLEDSSNRLFISYFSLLEIAIKKAAGKLSSSRNLAEKLQSLGVEILNADLPVLEKYKIFNDDNRDPFDNAIIAHAVLHSAVLLTTDQKILATSAPNLRTIDARL